MHDLSPELRDLSPDDATAPARSLALRLERREVLSVRRELQVLLYAAVATLVAGVGLLVKANLDRIGPVAMLAGLGLAAALCYGIALRARVGGRDRNLAEDYVLLLGALLASSAVAYAEVQFRWFGAGWSRHLLWLAAWHLSTAYAFGSRMLLGVALTAFAGWLGVEARLGTVLDPLHPRFGAGPRSLLCALVFYAGSRFHHRDRGHDRGSNDGGFRDVYLQFAVNFAFWGALALGGDAGTRWPGAVLLLVIAALVGRAGLRERRQSFLLYAVGYSTIGLVWLEALLLGSYALASWIGLFTVIGAVMLLLSLRTKLAESAP